ncbi:MAG: SAM-dependent methyltransferase [Rhodocyclaceae bacterium]|nr:SAM-dependent methyltransferase [Rhodocyclaceae bacterium]
MNLPEPSADALNHSNRLLQMIRARLARDGWMSFADYMTMALYQPGLGYYSGGSRKFGADGDFITAPELTPLFGQALARAVAPAIADSAPAMIEVGAGTGMLAADLLRSLEGLGCLPRHYDILELSGELRERQFDTLAKQVPDLASRVRWLDRLPDHFEGVVVANEVLDVMPVHLVASREDGLYERGVAEQDGILCWADRKAEGRLLDAARSLSLPAPAEGEYVTELNLAAGAWIREWAKRLRRGLMLLLDYGYPRAEYYLPNRSSGTLLCYYRHRAHGQPLQWPGLNDITAFVDFTAVAESAHDAGLEIYGYTSQASFLLNCGILELLEGRGARESAEYIRAARAVQRLTAPHEMGELFKVLAVGRDSRAAGIGFARGDRLHAL